MAGRFDEADALIEDVGASWDTTAALAHTAAYFARLGEADLAEKYAARAIVGLASIREELGDENYRRNGEYQARVAGWLGATEVALGRDGEPWLSEAKEKIVGGQRHNTMGVATSLAFCGRWEFVLSTAAKADSAS
jgi:hypothetical protein